MRKRSFAETSVTVLRRRVMAVRRRVFREGILGGSGVGERKGREKRNV